MKLTASIVLYKSNINDIKRVIDSIFSCSEHEIMLYLVDNSPTDGLSNLQTLYSDKAGNLVYIFLNQNIGFGSAHNIAINNAIQSKSKYHLVVNPDIYFSGDAIDKIVRKMETNKEVGLIMPKIIYPNREIQYLCKLLATPFDLFVRRFIPFSTFVERRNEKYEFRFTDYNTEMEIPSLSGCFMTIRTSVLEQIDGFDERYFMYLEDLDLCRRIGEVSRTLYYPAVSVTHEYEKGSYKNKKLLLYHVSSAIKYFNKWGWFWDKKRVRVNKNALLQFK